MPSEDFHPDLRRAARFAPRRTVAPRILPVIRALSTLRSRRAISDAEVITLRSGVGVRLFRPAHQAGGVSEPAPALLWIHGGGYLIGTAEMDDHVCAKFSKMLGITVASVEYRLAPEHPYPAAIEDCYSALTWLAGLPGVDPGRVAIGGASAGGGLAAALALLARDCSSSQGSSDRAVRPAFQLLVYPMLDDRSSMTTDKPNYRLWDTRANRFGWSAYLGDADPRVAVPARRDDLSGLPPAWIGVGTNDLFHDEDLAYAERLQAAGVPCDVEVVPGAFHGFDMWASKSLVSQRFFGSQCKVLGAGLAPVG
ncbi:alpha/beta hydrolase [Mycobacterium sp.]|uniref:alpha/beta hydrolase n=1 Tax=Mycobacterium sp. TaxID=1785 RepID=UPI003F99A233